MTKGVSGSCLSTEWVSGKMKVGVWPRTAGADIVKV